MLSTILILLFSLLALFLFYASYSIRSNVYIKTFSKKKTKEKIIALSFDDGPDPIQTPLVLDVLKEYNAKAAFFCVGKKLEGNEKIIKQMVDDGHLIANHSYSHSNFFPLYGFAKMKKDLQACHDKLEEISSQEIRFFRPPFGITNPTIAKLVRYLNYRTIGWNIRSFDTLGKAHAKTLARIERKISPGSIILLHDRMPESAVLLKKILELIQKKGYTVVSIESML